MLLQIPLDGVLQAYGSEVGYTDTRKSWAYPSKSAVLGMIARAGAMGWDDQKIAKLDRALTMTVFVMRSGGRLTDFHTVTSGTRSAEGKIRKAGIVSKRDYLVARRFLVILEGDAGVLEFVKESINHPQSIIYLGRASCIPSEPIIATYVDDFPAGWQEKVVECAPTDELAVMVRDRPMSATARSFLPRWVRVEKP